MRKILKHSWTRIPEKGHYKCQKCGCVRYWDFGFDRIMYSWGQKITYKAPDCIIITDVPYNK